MTARRALLSSRGRKTFALLAAPALVSLLCAGLTAIPAAAAGTAAARATTTAATAMTTAAAATSQLSNQLVDGDGSAASCSQSGYDETTDPGWTITSGDPNLVCYTNDGGFPDSSAPGAQPGNGYFTGGQRGSSSMTQTVNVAADAAAIDAGTATYNLSGWLGGYSSQNDRADVVATFLNSSGGAVGSTQIGPVTAADRGNTSDSCSAPPPASSRPAPGQSGWT